MNVKFFSLFCSHNFGDSARAGSKFKDPPSAESYQKVKEKKWPRSKLFRFGGLQFSLVDFGSVGRHVLERLLLQHTPGEEIHQTAKIQLQIKLN